jgi:sorbitol/mannitol transport system permease protein
MSGHKEIVSRNTRKAHKGRPDGPYLKLPSIVVLFVWSIIPLLMTLWFSFRRYDLMEPNQKGFDGFGNYRYLFSDPGLLVSIWHTVLLVGAVLVITIGLGTLLAVLFNQEFFGRGIARVLTLAPFFVMPTVSALVWKNMMLHPDNGVAAFVMRSVHLKPIDWFAVAPMTSIIAIVSWEWLPFAFLTLLTAVQSLDAERMEAARMDGAGPIALFRYIIWPHLDRAVIAVTMIESIFLLGIFAEIYVTTSGGPGYESSNLAFLIYRYALSEYDIGAASVCGVIAIVLANLWALLLMRSFARNVEG